MGNFIVIEKDKLKINKGKILSGRVYPEFFSFDKDDKVLNIGCGEGPQAIVYANQCKEMIGVDINEERMERSKKAMELYDVKNYKTVYANVESIPLPSESFDKAIAVDIIEHVQNPKKLCLEARRLLKEDGELLITLPAMHDRYTDLASWINSLIFKRKKEKKNSLEWNPSSHNHDYPVKKWIKIVEKCGFELKKSRASTLFPPLHLYGIPRFWFSNNTIHFIDSFFCKAPLLKNFGQALICVFRKRNNI